MFCINCGREIRDSDGFCPYCGSQAHHNQPKPAYTQSTYIPPVKEKKKSNCGCIGCGGCGGCVGCLGVIIISIIIIGLISLLFFGESSELDWSTEEAFEDIGTSVTDGSGHWGTDLGLNNLRDFYIRPKGDGSDVVTIMMYVLGSDLESESGFASDDIEEMLAADLGEQVNLILMTGGAHEWQNSRISNQTCQYWQIKDGKMVCLEKDLGKVSMAKIDTLSSFVSYAASEFPADRYGLICWNHGGGTMGGYGRDDHFPDDTLHLDDIGDALKKAGVLFDFVGFDACLMGTAENAYMLEPYADYLIASEEMEAGTGWYYTEWLTTLGENPSIATVDLGAKIIDDFVESCQGFLFDSEATLSIVELRQIPYTYEMMCNYFANASIALAEDDYAHLASARGRAKSYGEGDCEQVDIVDFVVRADLDGSDDVIAAVNSAVKYYRNSKGLTGSGMAMYFPYDYPDYYSDVQAVLKDVGYTKEYTTFFNQFVSAMVGGQIEHGQSNMETAEIDSGTYADAEWYDSEIADIYADTYDAEEYSTLPIVEQGDEFVLELSDDQWEDIIKIEQQVLLDDGEGYIDLGSDNMYEFDDDGNLLIKFDYTWVTLDGNTVPYYVSVQEEYEDDSWYTYGIVPAVLNSEEYIEIVVYWDDEVPTGYVAGYRKYSEAGTPLGKGLFELESGDQIEWLFDYYTYDWEYDDSYIVGDTYMVPDQEIEVSYDNVGDLDAVVYFCLTDIYNNVYESEAVIYTDE